MFAKLLLGEVQNNHDLLLILDELVDIRRIAIFGWFIL